MLPSFLLRFYVFLMLVMVPGCEKNPAGSRANQDEFASGGLVVKMSLDHFPALNEEATVYLQSNLKTYLKDSLAALGVDSVELGCGFGAQEDHEDAHDAFYPDTTGYLLTQFAGIYDTTHWEFKIKALRVGEFSIGAGIGPVAPTEIEDAVLRNIVGQAWGPSNTYTICVEEDQGYDCSP